MRHGRMSSSFFLRSIEHTTVQQRPRVETFQTFHLNIRGSGKAKIYSSCSIMRAKTHIIIISIIVIGKLQNVGGGLFELDFSLAAFEL